ncbi:MAG TPA: peptidoglycan DD-metalloendopeptidase family protein [Gemmatimonadaceae bacterium]|jgi:septal ring factor EnvC (AmiA/AmiB activator)|nr:peptidoglycan DD-metalloendopeptidase family protein [Gemmatimonadaceae bacterium]
MRRALLLLALAVAAPLAAQAPSDSRLRADRERLESLRREREELQRRMASLQSSVHDITEELANIEYQAETTARLVRSLETQLTSITEEVGRTTADMVRAEDELALKRAVLRKRLVDIYKRGPLFDVEVLFSARSFGDLVTRYKYLHLLALRDRALVNRVEHLRNEVARQRGNLVRFQHDIEENRTARAEEERRLRELESQRSASLADVKRRRKQTELRIARINRDERRLNNAIAEAEAARLRDVRARPNAAASTSTLRTSDLGQLDWPVDGTILYNFGRVVNPNNTTTRWNGIGISATEGTPVRSVAAGRVVVAEPFGTYGLTVIVQHGGGDYSVYGSLNTLSVEKGAVVSKGQTVGLVGAADPDLPAHLHFEIRPQGRAVDPLEWLRGRR